MESPAVYTVNLNATESAVPPGDAARGALLLAKFANTRVNLYGDYDLRAYLAESHRVTEARCARIAKLEATLQQVAKERDNAIERKDANSLRDHQLIVELREKLQAMTEEREKYGSGWRTLYAAHEALQAKLQGANDKLAAYENGSSESSLSYWRRDAAQQRERAFTAEAKLSESRRTSGMWLRNYTTLAGAVAMAHDIAQEDLSNGSE